MVRYIFHNWIKFIQVHGICSKCLRNLLKFFGEISIYLESYLFKQNVCSFFSFFYIFPFINESVNTLQLFSLNKRNLVLHTYLYVLLQLHSLASYTLIRAWNLPRDYRWLHIMSTKRYLCIVTHLLSITFVATLSSTNNTRRLCESIV